MSDAISFTNVTKQFGPKVAVADVTLQIRAGTTLGLVGPNGAGKTTLFSMAAGYLRPTSGTVTVLGEGARSVEALRGRIGVLPQDARLPTSDTVSGFLIFAARLQGMSRTEASEDAARVLREVDGIAWWNERASKLSHGMAKRVALAQALLGKPEVLLLDEPTAGLDPAAAIGVREIIRRRKGCTMIVSSHDLHEIEELCDSVAQIESGKLRMQSTIADLALTGDEVLIELGANDAEAVSAAIELLRGLPHVLSAVPDDKGPRLIVRFDPKGTTAEDTMANAMSELHQRGVRIVGMTKRAALGDRLFSGKQGAP